MYVYMYECMYVCMCVCMYVRMYVSMYAYFRFVFFSFLLFSTFNITKNTDKDMKTRTCLSYYAY